MEFTNVALINVQRYFFAERFELLGHKLMTRYDVIDAALDRLPRIVHEYKESKTSSLFLILPEFQIPLRLNPHPPSKYHHVHSTRDPHSSPCNDRYADQAFVSPFPTYIHHFLISYNQRRKSPPAKSSTSQSRNALTVMATYAAASLSSLPSLHATVSRGPPRVPSLTPLSKSEMLEAMSWSTTATRMENGPLRRAR